MTDQEKFEHEMQPHRRSVGNYMDFARQQIAALTFNPPEIEQAMNLQHEMSKGFSVACASKEEQMLVDVLQEHLGRFICVEDFKDCEMKYYEGRPDEYIFAHKGIDLGVVKKKMEIKYGYTDISDFTKNLFSIEQTITFQKTKQ